jgi:hypothetical protein
MPGVHELSRRIDLDELSFEGEKLSVDLTRSTPTVADAHVTRPLCRAEDAGADPPVDDPLRGQGSENAVRRSANLHAGQDVALSKVGDPRTRLLSMLFIFPPGYASIERDWTANRRDSLRASRPRSAMVRGRPCTHARVRPECRRRDGPPSAPGDAWRRRAGSIGNQRRARRHWPVPRADDQESRDASGRRWRETRHCWFSITSVKRPSRIRPGDWRLLLTFNYKYCCNLNQKV